jgi:SAM-dependent methyltransferase
MNAPQYLKHWETGQVWTHLGWAKHQTRLRRCTEFIRGRTFLDFGCAFGHSTAIMKDFLPGGWTGLEMDLRATRIAARLFPEINFVFLENLALVGELKTFDSVVCSEVIEHVPDPGDLIRSLVSLARFRIVITTPAVRVHDPGHLRLYSRESLEAELQAVPHEIHLEPPFFYAVILLGGADN